MLHSDPPPVSREVERLANTYANLILRLAYSRLGTTHAAQDICQDVFVKLITLTRATPTPFKDAEHEKAWIIRATANACINEQQAARNRKVVSLEDAQRDQLDPGAYPSEPAPTDPAAALEAAESHRQVFLALENLAPSQREAVYLHYCEGYSAKEIAQLTGQKPATVRQHLSRAHAKLRDLLEGEDL